MNYIIYRSSCGFSTWTSTWPQQIEIKVCWLFQAPPEDRYWGCSNPICQLFFCRVYRKKKLNSLDLFSFFQMVVYGYVSRRARAGYFDVLISRLWKFDCERPNSVVGHTFGAAIFGAQIWSKHRWTLSAAPSCAWLGLRWGGSNPPGPLCSVLSSLLGCCQIFTLKEFLRPRPNSHSILW